MRTSRSASALLLVAASSAACVEPTLVLQRVDTPPGRQSFGAAHHENRTFGDTHAVAVAAAAMPPGVDATELVWRVTEAGTELELCEQRPARPRVSDVGQRCRLASFGAESPPGNRIAIIDPIHRGGEVHDFARRVTLPATAGVWILGGLSVRGLYHCRAGDVPRCVPAVLEGDQLFPSEVLGVFALAEPSSTPSSSRADVVWIVRAEREIVRCEGQPGEPGAAVRVTCERAAQR